MPMIILDLDGVLTDFAGGVAALFGRDAPGAESSGQALHDSLGITVGQMWSRIGDAGRTFWEGLEPTEHAEELVSLARDHGDIFVATSPSADASSAAGKVRWLQKRFGKRFRDYAITSNKHLLAKRDRLLIDDSSSHVDAFQLAGGRAVLFPTWDNGRREDGVDPLADVRMALESLS